MHIRTKIKISIAVSIVLLFLISGILLWSTHQLEESRQKEKVIQQIIKDTFELNDLTNDYILYHEERSKVQWYARHKEIGLLLESEVISAPEETEILDEMRMDHQSINRSFTDLSTSLDDSSGSMSELEKRLVGQLQIRSQSIVSSTFKLSTIIYQNVASIRLRMDYLMVLLVAVLVFTIMVNAFYIFRSLSKPINELSEIALQIGKGNFNVKYDMITNDELDQLGNALNTMVEDLKKLDYEKKEFISIAAHELKTPLASIKGFSSLLIDGKSKKKMGDYLRIIIDDANRLDGLVTKILDLSRLDMGTLHLEYTEVDVKETIEEIKKEVSILFKTKKLRAVYNIDKDLPVIETDKEKLIQILSNLILNAIHYTEKGNVITSIKKQGDMLLFCVTDTGIGIPPEQLPKLFKKFYQVDNFLTRKTNGAGLGLALCKGFVEALGGKIWVESKMGKGSTLSFTLPIKKKEDAQKDVKIT